MPPPNRYSNIQLTPGELPDMVGQGGAIDKASAATPGPPMSLKSALTPSSPIWETGSADLLKPFNPKTYLKSLPRQVGADQIDGMHPEFASRFAMFSKDVQQMYPKYEISAGYDSTGQHHMPGSWHYVGQAADVVPDREFHKTPENMKKLTFLADKYGLTLFDEWDETNRSHFHIMIPNKLPKGMTPELMSDGRRRNRAQLEDYLKAYAGRVNMDPDLVTNMLRHETNYEKDHVGQDGRLGMGRLSRDEITAVLKNKYPNFTIRDYMESPNLQAQVFVDHLYGLTDPEAGGYGNTAKAITAYKSGRDKVSQIESDGILSDPATKQYLSRILGIPEDKVEEAFLTGNGVEYDIQKIREKVRDQKINAFGTPILGSNIAQVAMGAPEIPPIPEITMPGGVTPGVSKQMLRNAVDMVNDVGTTSTDLLSGMTAKMREYGLDNTPFVGPVMSFADQSLQRVFPMVALPEALNDDGTVDDKHWAVSTVRAQLNNAFMNIPGAVVKNLRPSMEYDEWKDGLTGAAHNVLAASDFFMSLPMLTYGAEVAIPKSAAAAIGATAKGSQSLAKLVGAESVIERLFASGAASAVEGAALTEASNTAASYSLKSILKAGAPAITNAASFATLMGVAATAKTYQQYIELGADEKTAVSAAMGAGMLESAVVGAIGLAFPAIGGILLSPWGQAATKFAGNTARGAANIIEKASRTSVISMAEAGAFGPEGVSAAKMMRARWENIPAVLKDVAVAESKKAFDMLSKAEQTGIVGFVTNSIKKYALMHHVALNESSQRALIEKTAEALEMGRSSQRMFEFGLEKAEKEVQHFRNRVGVAEGQINKLSQQPEVAQYLTNEARLNTLMEQRGKNADAFGRKLVDDKGKLTASGQAVEKEITTLQAEMHKAATAAVPKDKMIAELEASFEELKTLQDSLNNTNKTSDNLWKKLSEAKFQQHHGVPGADELVADAQKAIADARARIQELSQTHPEIANYLNLKSQYDILANQMATNKSALGETLNNGNGKLTPAGQNVKKQMDSLVNQMRKASMPSKSVYEAGANSIQAMIKIRRELDEPQKGLRSVLAAVENQDFFKNANQYKQALRNYDFINRNFKSVLATARQQVIDGNIPDYKSAIMLTPLPDKMTNVEKRIFPLFQEALLSRVNAAVDQSSDAVFSPLYKREMALEMDRLPLSTRAVSPRTETEKGTADTIISNFEQFIARMRNNSAKDFRGMGIKSPRAEQKRIQEMIEEAKAFKTRVEGIPGTGDSPGVKGAAAYTPEALVPPLVRKEAGASYGPEGVPMAKLPPDASGKPQPVPLSEFIKRALDVKTEEYPMGLPISAFADKGFEYALSSTNPIAAKITGDALYKMGSQLISESTAKSLEGARVLQEAIESGMVAKDPMVESFRTVDRFMDLSSQQKRDLNNIVTAGNCDLSNAGDVYSMSRWLFDWGETQAASSKRIAAATMERSQKSFFDAVGLKPGKDAFPREIELELIEAVESRDKQKLIQTLNQSKKIMVNGKERVVDYSKFADGLKTYFDVMTATERFTLQSPNMSEMFRAGYYWHMYPRALAFLREGAEHHKVISGSAPFEKSRTIASIKEADILSKKAEQEIFDLSGGKVKDWKDFVYVKNKKGMTDMETRASMLGVSTEKANQLLHDVLLGDAVTDISQVLANSVYTRMRVNTTRQLMDVLRRIPGDTGYMLLQDKRLLNNEVVMSTKSIQGDARKHWLSTSQRKPYAELTSLPGLAAYPDAEHYLIHPQIASLVQEYLLMSPAEDWGKLNPFSKLFMVMRGTALMGWPQAYMNGLMCNYSTLVNGNLAKAYGFVPIGASIQDTDYMYRGFAAGLRPMSIMGAIASVGEDWMSAARQVPMLADAMRNTFGMGTPFSKMMEKTQGVLPLNRFNPVVMMQDLDAWFNKQTMFKVLTNAQIGAWVHHTGQLMQARGPQMIEELGSYGAALMVAERQAAEHVNRLGGVIATHMTSDKLRRLIYATMLAPGYFSARWDTLVASFDALISTVSKDATRSRYAWAPSKEMEASFATNRKAQLGKFLASSMVLDTMYTNMLAIALQKDNRPAYLNPPGKQLSIQLGDSNTWLSAPFFGMLTPFFKSALAIKDGDSRRMFDIFLGQLHPFYRAVEELARSHGQQSSKLPNDIMNPEFWNAIAREVASRSFNLEEIGYREGYVPPGMGILGSNVGIPMDRRDFLLHMATGLTVSKSSPLEEAWAMQMAKRQMYAKAQMASRVKSMAEYYTNQDLTPEERNKLKDETVKLLTKTGVNQGDKSLQEYYKKQGYHPDGNYVVLNMSDVRQIMDKAFDPEKHKYDKVSRVLRQMVYDEANERFRDQALAALRWKKPGQKITDQEIQAEIERRAYGSGLPNPEEMETLPDIP